MQAHFSLKSVQSLDLNSRAVQSVALFGSTTGAMGFNFLSSLFTTRLLGADSYGDYSFVLTVWAFFYMVSTFGYIYSGSRILVVENDTVRIQELLGAVLAIAATTGCGLMTLVVLLAYPIDQLFHSRIADIMIRFAPLIIILPLRDALSLALQSINRIILLATLNLLPAMLYFAGLIVYSKLMSVTPSEVLFLHQITILIIILPIIGCLRPSFRSMPRSITAIVAENKRYGWPVYLGALAGVATGHLNSLAISYWADNRSLGFYSLTSSLTQPLKLIPNAVATASYRDFAGQKKISPKLLLATVAIVVLSLLASLFLFGVSLSWIYPQDFASVGPMAQAASFGAVLYGFGDFCNRFLGAHGKGKMLRNTAFLVGIANVAGFFVLVPLWGAWGAVFAGVLVGATYLFFMFLSYRQYLRSNLQEFE